MKYPVPFGSSSTAALALKQREFEVGSLLGINIPDYLWKENSMFNISRSTHSKDPFFGIHMDIITNFRLSGKKSSVGASGKEIFQFIWRIGRKSNGLQLNKA